MKLWLLTQCDNTGYDTYDSCVVAAITEQEAKKIHPMGQDGWEQNDIYQHWATSIESVIATCIGTAKKVQLLG